MAGHDLVIHLASNPDIQAAMVDPAIDFDQGTLITHHVLEALRRSGVKRIAYAAGSGVYGDLGEVEADEDYGPLLPVSPYGASKLAGEALESRSGALAASIAAEVSGDGEDVAATVDSFGDVKYAAIQEYGGKTGAHEILPSKASVLAFVTDGAMHFARRVEHPGSLIPERSYLRSSLDEMSAEIVAALAAAASESWEQT